MSISSYAALDAVNFSTLKEFAISALRYKHRLSQPRVDTDGMRCGRIDHRAILQPETIADLPAWPGGNRIAAALAAFVRANGEDYVWKEQEREDALALSAAVHAHPVAGPLVRLPGECEKAIVKVDPRTGIMRKARVDKLCAEQIVEVKTSKQTIDPRMIQRQITGFSYHVQAAWYLDVTGLDRFSWIFVEQNAPHDVAVVYASDEWIELGRHTYERWLDQLVECRRTDRWPGVCDGAMEIDVPLWAAEINTDPGLDLIGLEGL